MRKTMMSVLLGVTVLGLMIWSGLQTALADPLNIWRDSGSNIYYNAGRVGIGTSSPQDRLHLKNGVLRLSNSSNSPRIEMIDEADGDLFSIFLHRANNEIQVDSNDAQNILVLEKGGKVGIGNLNPQAKLEIAANNNHLKLREADNDDKQWQIEVSSGRLQFVETGVGAKMKLSSTGNICIGKCQ